MNNNDAARSRPLKRREFLKQAASVAAGGAGAAILSGCTSQPDGAPAVHTKKNVVWRLTSSFTRSLDTLYGATEYFAARVEALSEGRFRIRTYPAGEIVPALQVLDAVQRGTVQMGQTASYYFVGKNPALAFECCVPFGLSSRQQMAWLYEGGGLDLTRKVFADFNILNFPGGNTGVQMGGWFQRELHGLSDLQGLKMRIPGIGGRVMSRLGTTVQVLPGGEIFPALERGAIDATEWVGPYDDEKLGFYKVARYYYYPGWWEPGPNLSFYVNADEWAKLPATYQSIVESACREAAVIMQARYDARNPGALERLLQQGVQLRRFPDDILQAAERESMAVLQEEADRDPAYRSLFDTWKKARGDSFEWFATAELAYAQAAFTQRAG
jgi:TRAP-type mannitol/chloroaromatic compound transport system substrate-binding protein